jgi:quercetin dioxygenase-like cupin family protein
VKKILNVALRVLLVTFVLAVGTKSALGQDPVKVAPDVYKVLLDNDRVRVLDVHVKPGQKTAMHSHPANVIYAFDASTTKFSFPGKKSQTRSFKAGDVVWGGPEKHAGENTGSSEVHVLVFEIKGGKAGKTVKGADPVKVDPKSFKVRLNNARVRVLEFTGKPGDKFPMHTHPDYVAYTFSGGKTTYTFPDGKTAEREVTPGTATFNKSEAHAGTIGGTETHTLLVELKAPRPAPKKEAQPTQPK